MCVYTLGCMCTLGCVCMCVYPEGGLLEEQGLVCICVCVCVHTGLCVYTRLCVYLCVSRRGNAGRKTRDLYWVSLEVRPLLYYLTEFPQQACRGSSTANRVCAWLKEGHAQMPCTCTWASLVAKTVKNLPAMWETWVQSLGWEDSLEKEMATHSSILAWRIPRTLQSIRSQRVGQD